LSKRRIFPLFLLRYLSNISSNFYRCCRCRMRL